MSEVESNVVELDIESKSTTPKTEYKVDAETADLWFQKWADEYNIDTDVDHMDAEGIAGLEKQKSRVILAIRLGNLVFNDKSEPVFTPRFECAVATITFGEPSGGNLMEMDGKKENYNVTKMFAVMAGMTRTNTEIFSKMKKHTFSEGAIR